MPAHGAENPNPAEPPNASPFYWALALSALTALAVGPLDALLNFLAAPLGDWPPPPARVHIILGAGLMLTLLCFVGLLASFLGLLLVTRPPRPSFRRITFVLAALPFAGLLKSAIGSFALVGFGGPAARAAYIAAVGLTMAAFLYLAARGPVAPPALARGMAWLLPPLSMGALGLVYQQMSTETLAAAPAWTVGTAVNAAVWATILISAIFCYWLRPAITLRTAAAIGVCGVVLIGALGVHTVPARSHGSQSFAGAAAGERNVILISIDTLRADRLGAYGANPSKTPNIDQFADGGTVFENAYSTGPWTLPGIASFLTGMNPVANGADCRPPNCALSESVITLGERFRDAGYRTAAFGSNVHVTGRNLLQGMGEYRFGPFATLPHYSPGSLILWRLWPAWFGDAAASRDITNSAIDWLDRNKSHRFFLWVHYLDPHVPYSALPPDSQGHPKARALMNRSAQLPNRSRAGEEFPPDWIETIKALYESETADVDGNVGRVLDHLRELDLYDDAVILLTGDHGEELWDHGRYEHGHALYDELLRVPLIVKAPSVSPGRVAVRVATTQTPSTIVEAAGLDTEDAYWAPSLSRAGAAQDKTLLIAGTLYFDRQMGIIFDNRKYTRNLDDGSELLFDLAADPDERRPLTDQRSLDAARQRLDERLRRSTELRALFRDETPAPDNIPPDLLRSLGYL